MEPAVAALAAYLHKLPHSKLDRWGIAGMCAAVIGTAAVVYPTFSDKPENASEKVSIWLILATVISPIAHGYGAILNKVLLTKQSVPVLVSVLGQSVFEIICITLIWISNSEAKSVGEQFANATVNAWICIFSMAIMSVVLCWFFLLGFWKESGQKQPYKHFLSPCIALFLGASFKYLEFLWCLLD